MNENDKYVVPRHFVHTAQRLQDKVAMRHKKQGLWQEVTWQEYYQRARELALAMLAMGVEKGDFVGVLGENSPEWLYIDMATQMVGAVTVGIYTTNSAGQVRYIVDHAGCKLLFAENEEQVDKWLAFREECPGLEKVIYWDDKGLRRLQIGNLLDFQQVLLTGREKAGDLTGKLQERIEQAVEEDLAILVYTSGTTGPPKGVMLTSKNLLWSAEGITKMDPDGLLFENEEIMSFLPLCHIFERMFSVYIQLVMGYTLNFVERIDTVAQNLREIHPTIGYAVPRIWEKYYSSIYIRMKDAKPVKRLVYGLALKSAMAYSEAKLAGKQPSLRVRIANFFAQRFVFYYLKERLGMEKMRFAFSGAAPISPDILAFFNAIGLPLFEGYGMTETSALLTFSTPKSFKLGTVGKPFPGVDFKISEEGEILARHPGVFKGYYKNPEATDAALQDGWMHTGDIGEVDDEGFVRIVDRKKDIIITAGGKNIAPQYIENKLKFSPYINDAIVIGDRRKFLTAIIVLDEDNINKFAQDNKVQYSTYADLAEHPDIRELIEKEVNNVNGQLARVESVRKFTILNKRLYQEDGEVTPTMKVKRKHINETYKDLIEAMYRK